MKKNTWTFTNRNGKETTYAFAKNKKYIAHSQPQEIIPFPDDDIEIYCEEGDEDIFCKDMYILYSYVKDYEPSLREQLMRDLCPEISDEMLHMALECFAMVERKNLSIAEDEQLSRKELRRIQKENDSLTFPY